MPTLHGQTVDKAMAICPRSLLYFTLHSCYPRYFRLKNKTPLLPGTVGTMQK